MKVLLITVIEDSSRLAKYVMVVLFANTEKVDIFYIIKNVVVALPISAVDEDSLV